MKKSLSLILALFMILSCVFSLASCKGGDNESKENPFGPVSKAESSISEESKADEESSAKAEESSEEEISLEESSAEEISEEVTDKIADGIYAYSDMELKFLMNGEDMSEYFGNILDLEETNAAIVIEGNKMTFIGDDDEDTETTFELKDGKLIVYEKDMAGILGDMNEDFEEADLDLYFTAEGDTITMYLHVLSSAEGFSVEIEIVADFVLDPDYVRKSGGDDDDDDDVYGGPAGTYTYYDYEIEAYMGGEAVPLGEDIFDDSGLIGQQFAFSDGKLTFLDGSEIAYEVGDFDEIIIDEKVKQALIDSMELNVMEDADAEFVIYADEAELLWLYDVFTVVNGSDLEVLIYIYFENDEYYEKLFKDGTYKYSEFVFSVFFDGEDYTEVFYEDPDSVFNEKDMEGSSIVINGDKLIIDGASFTFEKGRAGEFVLSEEDKKIITNPMKYALASSLGDPEAGCRFYTFGDFICMSVYVYGTSEGHDLEFVINFYYDK